MEKISIIVPVYNAEKYILRCCNSILNQSYKNIELILVNDGSTDKSLEICDEICAKDQRVTLKTIPNQGVAVARNTGLDLASGKYIMFVDADDWLELGTLDKIANKMSEDLDILVFSYYQEYGEVIKNISMKSYTVDMFQLLDHIYELPDTNSLLCTVWNKVYKKSLLESKQIRFIKDIPFGEDFLFNMDYFKVTKRITCNELFVYHYNCINFESATHKFFPQYKNYIRLMYDKFKELFEYHDITSNQSFNYLYDFIIDRYEYAMTSCIEENLNLTKKCEFLHNLVLDMDLDMCRYSEKSNRTISILIEKRCSKIFYFYVIKIIFNRKRIQLWQKTKVKMKETLNVK